MAQFPTNGLLAAYSFTGNTNDVSGNDNHAVNCGAVPSIDRFGQAGCCYRFTGSDSYIQTPVNSNLSTLTLCVWFRTDTRSGSRSIVDSDSANHFGHSLILGYGNADNILDIQYHNGWWNSQWRLNDSVWHHAVGVFTQGNVALYMDGVLIGSESYYHMPPDGTNFRIGRHNPGEPRWFVGEIDDVLLYDRALTPAEIKALYQTTPTAADDPAFIPRAVMLRQNYPNPFNPATSVGYGVPDDGPVLLRVYDVHGRIVAELVNGTRKAGMSIAEFNGSALPSGVYIYRLEAGGMVLSRTMLLLR